MNAYTPLLNPERYDDAVADAMDSIRADKLIDQEHAFLAGNERVRGFVLSELETTHEESLIALMVDAVRNPGDESIGQQFALLCRQALLSSLNEDQIEREAERYVEDCAEEGQSRYREVA